MKKDKEELTIAGELRRCAEILIEISEKLNISEASDAIKVKDDSKKEVKLKLEDVRAVLAEKSRSGFTKEIKEILNKHGVSKLSEVEESEYAQILSEVEVL